MPLRANDMHKRTRRGNGLLIRPQAAAAPKAAKRHIKNPRSKDKAEMKLPLLTGMQHKAEGFDAECLQPNCSEVVFRLDGEEFSYQNTNEEDYSMFIFLYSGRFGASLVYTKSLQFCEQVFCKVIKHV